MSILFCDNVEELEKYFTVFKRMGIEVQYLLPSQLENVNNHIIVMNRAGSQIMTPVSCISHIEVIRHCVYFRMIDGNELKFYSTIKDVSEKLKNSKNFIRCHRSYIVNISDVVSFSKNEFTMKSGRKVPISRNYQAYIKGMFDSEENKTTF